MKNFIKTTDKETADLLLNAGYILVNTNNNHWTFLNNEKKIFSEAKNVVYTDILGI